MQMKGAFSGKKNIYVYSKKGGIWGVPLFKISLTPKPVVIRGRTVNGFLNPSFVARSLKGGFFYI